MAPAPRARSAAAPLRAAGGVGEPRPPRYRERELTDPTPARIYPLDMSGGSGLISSPDPADHQPWNRPLFRKVVVRPMERVASRFAQKSPRPLLVGLIAILAKEVATRQIESDLSTAPDEAIWKPGATSVIRQAQQNLDTRIQKILRQGYASMVDEEIRTLTEDPFGSIFSRNNLVLRAGKVLTAQMSDATLDLASSFEDGVIEQLEMMASVPELQAEAEGVELQTPPATPPPPRARARIGGWAWPPPWARARPARPRIEQAAEGAAPLLRTPRSGEDLAISAASVGALLAKRQVASGVPRANAPARRPRAARRPDGFIAARAVDASGDSYEEAAGPAERRPRRWWRRVRSTVGDALSSAVERDFSARSRGADLLRTEGQTLTRQREELRVRLKGVLARVDSLVARADRDGNDELTLDELLLLMSDGGAALPGAERRPARAAQPRDDAAAAPADGEQAAGAAAGTGAATSGAQRRGAPPPADAAADAAGGGGGGRPAPAATSTVGEWAAGLDERALAMLSRVVLIKSTTRARSMWDRMQGIALAPVVVGLNRTSIAARSQVRRYEEFVALVDANDDGEVSADEVRPRTRRAAARARRASGPRPTLGPRATARPRRPRAAPAAGAGGAGAGRLRRAAVRAAARGARRRRRLPHAQRRRALVGRPPRRPRHAGHRGPQHDRRRARDRSRAAQRCGERRAAL